MNALELYEGLNEGKKYIKGGGVETMATGGGVGDINMDFLKVFQKYGFINSESSGHNTYKNKNKDIIVFSPKSDTIGKGWLSLNLSSNIKEELYLKPFTPSALIDLFNRHGLLPNVNNGKLSYRLYSKGGGVGDDLRKRLNPNINEAINHFEHTSVIQQGSKLDLTLRKKYGNFPQDLYIDIDGDNSFTLKFDDRADAFIVYDLTKSKYAEGGSVEAENKEMVLNNNKQIAHHTEEMNMAVKNAKNVPAWVVAKVNRSATDLSDATHYMEGQGESYAEGGAIYRHKHMDATAKILEKTNKGYKVEFTDNSMKKPKTKIMYFLDINFDKDKGYFEKMETGGGVGEKWQIKDSNDKYFSVSMQTGNPVWNESPDLGYSYEKQEAKKIKDKLEQLGNKNLKIVEYNPNWWKMKTGGGVEKSVLHLYKLTYPNGQYIVEDYNGGSMTPKEALEKMRISLRGFKSYKYASASSDSDNYKKWHTKKSIGYSNTEAWDEVFGKEKYEKGGGVDSIKITKNEFQFRKDEPKRVYHSYEGTLGDYIFYAETDNSFKSGYGSYGINKGSIYKLSIRKVLDNGMHNSIAEYSNKWDYRTKNAKDGAIRSKIIKYIDSISDEKKGTPKKYKQGGGVEWDKDSDSIRTELGEFRVRITPQMQKGYYDVYVSANKKEIGKKYDVYGIANAKDIALEIISNSNKFDKGGMTKGWKHKKK